jgi:hypothetical protein
MFWMYGRQIGRPWYEVPFLLKRVCLGGTAVFLGLYIYWWFMIMGIAKNEVKSWFIKGGGKAKRNSQEEKEMIENLKLTQNIVNDVHKSLLKDEYSGLKMH